MKFLRRNWNKYSKLGKKRKKKQVWRRPTGRDNKMRERRKGYPARVSIGYKQQKDEQKEIMKVNNLNDLMKIQKNEVVILGKMGKKKKIEIVKKAKERNIKIDNLNIKKFLKMIEKKDKKIKEEKEKASTKTNEVEKKNPSPTKEDNQTKKVMGDKK